MLSDKGSPQFKKLQQAYRESFDAKRKGLEECWQVVQENGWSEESLLRLKLHIHHLAGSAAPYGFEAISDTSSELEKLVLDLLVGNSPPARQHAIRARIRDSLHALTATLAQEYHANG